MEHPFYKILLTNLNFTSEIQYNIFNQILINYLHATVICAKTKVDSSFIHMTKIKYGW